MVNFNQIDEELVHSSIYFLTRKSICGITTKRIMKRGGNSMAFTTNRKGTTRGKFSHMLLDDSGPSFSDLPTDIMVNILVRLPIKRIFVCKIVCKTWHFLISELEFAKLHLAQAQAYPLIQVFGFNVQTRLIYLMQPEEDLFEHKLEMRDRSEYNSKCDCHVQLEFETNSKLLLQILLHGKDSGRNMVDHVSVDNGGAKTSLPKSMIELKNRSDNEKDDPKRDFSRFLSVAGGVGAGVPPLALPVGLKRKDHKYRIVNSCNGLVCFSNPNSNQPLIVCNPVTTEFINLPEVKVDLDGDLICCGFGFSPASNQYKLIVMFRRCTRAKVHTLGTETWRDTNLSNTAICRLRVTYLNGFLYWPYYEQTLGLLSFDIENECFGSIPGPPVKGMDGRVGVLGGELSINICTSNAIEVWVLKDCGTRNAWSRVFSIQHDSDKCWHFAYRRCHPTKYLNDGELLMFHWHTNSLIYTHPTKQRIRRFEVGGRKADLEVFTHIPSFVPLKDALSGHNVKVLK